MKKIKLAFLPILALVFGIGLSAFTTSSAEQTSQTDPLHWFDVNNGQYLGLQTLSTIQNGDCDGEGNDCADGYTHVDFPVPDEDPVPRPGTYETTIEKE